MFAQKPKARVQGDVAPARKQRAPAPGSVWNAFTFRACSPSAPDAPARDDYFGRRFDHDFSTTAACPPDRAAIQRKADVDVGSFGDPLEREADRVADEVMRGARASVRVATTRVPTPRARAAFSADEGTAPDREEAPRSACRRPRDGAHPPTADTGLHVDRPLAHEGEPLPVSTQTFMERRFGRDFSAVRIHTGPAAADAAAALRARAFTLGTNVAFASNEYAPSTEGGRRLVAHELAHVVQQARGAAGAAAVMRKSAPGGPTLVPQPATPGKGSATASEPFASQPKDLQDVFRATFGGNAADEFRKLWHRRLDFVAIYNRLSMLGLWSHVRAVCSVGERERSFWGGLEAPGATASVVFATDESPRDLIAAALGTMRLCADSPLGASQHRDQVSMREVSDGDSLHLSVGPRPGDVCGRFDAHIDRYSSARGGAGSVCAYDIPSASAHIGREVVPSKVRSWMRVPGVQVLPEWEGGASGQEIGRGGAGEAPPPVVGMTWRFKGL